MLNLKPKVIFACSGVGHIERGYETHILDLFNQIKNSQEINVVLIKGGGLSGRNCRRIYCIKRNSLVANVIFKIFGKPAYMIEQISFFLMSIFYILKESPRVIYSPDFTLLRLYVILKKVLGLKYKTILCNGGNYQPPYYGIDIVQFILPNYAKNIKFENNIVVPHGFDIDKFIPKKSKKQYKIDLGLPLGKKIILSVGAINMTVKRMDYIINEVAELSNPELFLLLVGQKDEESEIITKLGKQKLDQNFEVRSVGFDVIQDYYLASDLFCLASLHETFGKVYVEAGLSRLPIFVHDFEVSRIVLDGYAIYGNFNNSGILCNLIKETLNNELKYDLNKASEYLKYKYSWDILTKQYISMFTSKCKSL